MLSLNYTQIPSFRLYVFIWTVFFVLMRRTHFWSLSKHFRTALKIKNTRERGAEDSFGKSWRSKEAYSNASWLSRLSLIPVNIWLFATRTTNSEICPIKGPTRLKQTYCRGAGRRRRLDFVCLKVKFMLLSLLLKPNWGLEWLFV